MKHVALVMSLDKRFDRKVIEGATRFVREWGQYARFPMIGQNHNHIVISCN